MSRVKKTVKRAYLGTLLSRNGTENRLVPHCSTAELVARQNAALGFARMDLFVLYLAIQESEGGNRGGIDLLEKLLRVDPNHRTTDRALLAVLRRDRLSTSPFVAARPEVDPELNLHSELGAVALAIHAGEPRVAVRWTTPPLRMRERPRYDAAWLRGHGFTTAEIASLRAAQDEVFERLGISSLPWETIAELRAEMKRHLPPGVTLHGRGDLYQSCEELLIPGQRPTALRVRAYELPSILSPTDRVLDIGCNCGFLALHAARYVEAMDGFDVAAHFVAIARLAQTRLGRGNCRFTTSSFRDFAPTHPYDVIFSFAVHHWIGLGMAEYGIELRKLLRPGGLVLLESQDLSTHDRDWDKKLDDFRSTGFEEVRSGTLCDDGILARRHVLLRDSRAIT